MIDVVLVDDDTLLRAGIRLILDQTSDIAVVAEASDGGEAVGVVRRLQPHVVLMDVRMPNMNGIEATAEITSSANASRVIMLTTFELDEYVFAALRAGASGFLLKRTPPDDLIGGIRSVAAGEGLLSPSVTRRLIEEFANVPATPTGLDPRISRLTDREAEILGYIARGLTNQELAETLFIAENTVKTHVKRILAKLGARDRVQAVVIAYESGFTRESER